MLGKFSNIHSGTPYYLFLPSFYIALLCMSPISQLCEFYKSCVPPPDMFYSVSILSFQVFSVLDPSHTTLTYILTVHLSVPAASISSAVNSLLMSSSATLTIKKKKKTMNTTCGISPNLRFFARTLAFWLVEQLWLKNKYKFYMWNIEYVQSKVNLIRIASYIGDCLCNFAIFGTRIFICQ